MDLEDLADTAAEEDMAEEEVTGDEEGTEDEEDAVGMGDAADAAAAAGMGEGEDLNREKRFSRITQHQSVLLPGEAARMEESRKVTSCLGTRRVAKARVMTSSAVSV